MAKYYQERGNIRRKIQTEIAKRKYKLMNRVYRREDTNIRKLTRECNPQGAWRDGRPRKSEDARESGEEGAEREERLPLWEKQSINEVKMY